MKKLLLFAVMMLVCIVAQAEVYYYNPSGTSPEDNQGYIVYVVVKDNSGQLWILQESKSALRQRLLNNRDFYVEVFNKGNHIDCDRTYNENHIFNGTFKFSKLILQEKTSKCYVLLQDDTDCVPRMSFCKYKLALGLDYRTLIYNCDRVSPSYYTSVPVDRFIVRRSVDDLF